MSAASGLVALGEHLVVVADDDHALAVFPAHGDAPGRLVAVFDDPLPTDRARRKARKADLEILLHVPAPLAPPHGALLALGSGSTSRRDRGACLPLDARGVLRGDVRPLDLAPLYARLRTRLPALNLEGAAIVGDALVLLHRASGADRRNACVRLPRSTLQRGIDTGAFDARDADIAITVVDLGELEGAPWGFTDAAALDDGRIVFSAAAEAADDAYADGPLRGAALGWLTPDGRLGAMHRLALPHKVEGIAVQRIADGVALRMVTDADDPGVPALLLATVLPLP